jgi:hypothetical protein
MSHTQKPKNILDYWLGIIVMYCQVKQLDMNNVKLL